MANTRHSGHGGILRSTKTEEWECERFTALNEIVSSLQWAVLTASSWASIMDLAKRKPYFWNVYKTRLQNEWCHRTGIKSFREAWWWRFYMFAGLFPLQRCSLSSSNHHRFCRGFFSPSDTSVWQFSVIFTVTFATTWLGSPSPSSLLGGLDIHDI